MLTSSAMADTIERAGLPRRVDAFERNLNEFRVEVRQEFAAVRDEIVSVRAALKAEIRAVVSESADDTHRQLFMVHEDLVQRIGDSKEETRRQMREMNDETRRHMLVLHEDLIQRIATIGEAR
jgi:hypothetical protein